MRDKRNKFVGKVNAVECEGCFVETHSVPVGVLGVKNLKITVEDGVVIVANKAWCRKFASERLKFVAKHIADGGE